MNLINLENNNTQNVLSLTTPPNLGGASFTSQLGNLLVTPARDYSD